MLDNPNLILEMMGMCALEAIWYFGGGIMIVTPDWKSGAVEKRASQMIECFGLLQKTARSRSGRMGGWGGEYF